MEKIENERKDEARRRSETVRHANNMLIMHHHSLIIALLHCIREIQLPYRGESKNIYRIRKQNEKVHDQFGKAGNHSKAFAIAFQS